MALAVRRRTGAALHLQRFADLLSSWWRACFFFVLCLVFVFFACIFFVALHVRFFFFLSTPGRFLSHSAGGHQRPCKFECVAESSVHFYNCRISARSSFRFLSLSHVLCLSVRHSLSLSLSLSPRSASLSWVWTPGRATHSRPGFDGDATLWFASLAHHRLHYRNER